MGEWVRALPCGCVMQVGETFLKKGWFLTDSTITPCAEHPKKRLPKQWRARSKHFEVFGPMEDKWFGGHGVLLEGADLKKAEAWSSAANDSLTQLHDLNWRKWDGNKHR